MRRLITSEPGATIGDMHGLRGPRWCSRWQQCPRARHSLRFGKRPNAKPLLNHCTRYRIGARIPADVSRKYISALTLRGWAD